MSEDAVLTKRHLHSYKRVKHPRRRDLWMCADPKCAHRTNKIWLLGKSAQCFYCQAEFIVTSTKLKKQGFLHCDDCKRGGTGKQLNGTMPSVTDIETILNKEVL